MWYHLFGLINLKEWHILYGSRVAKTPQTYKLGVEEGFGQFWRKNEKSFVDSAPIATLQPGKWESIDELLP